MNVALSIVLIIFGWISTGLIIGIILYWKKEQIAENKWNYLYLAFLGLFVVIDIITMVAGGTPVITASCAVYIVASLIRSDEWPNDPKFAEYIKTYIIILSVTLLPGLIMIGFSNLPILSAAQPDNYMAFALGTFFAPILIPLIIILGSDPTNRYGTIEKERIIGGLLAIAGAILGVVIGTMGFASGQYILLDVLGIMFSVTALGISVLIFLSIKLGNV